jgi:hypothetical protein
MSTTLQVKREEERGEGNSELSRVPWVGPKVVVPLAEGIRVKGSELRVLARAIGSAQDDGIVQLLSAPPKSRASRLQQARSSRTLSQARSQRVRQGRESVRAVRGLVAVDESPVYMRPRAANKTTGCVHAGQARPELQRGPAQPRLFGVTSIKFHEAAARVNGSYDQAVRHCGLPAFPNLPGGVAQGGVPLPSSAAMIDDLGSAVCNLLVSGAGNATLCLRGIRVAVDVRPGSYTGDNLAVLGTCITFSLAGVSDYADPRAWMMWVSPSLTRPREWVVIGLESQSGLYTEPPTSVYALLVSALVGLRIGGCSTTWGALRPGSYNVIESATVEALWAGKARYPAVDATIGTLPMQVWGPGWSNLLFTTELGNSVVMKAYRRFGQAGDLGRLECTGAAGALPVADVLHIGPPSARVAVCAVKVRQGAGDWEYILTPSAWCQLDAIDTRDLGSRVLADESEIGPEYTFNNWGCLVSSGPRGMAECPTILHEALIAKMMGQDAPVHAYVHDVTSAAALLTRIANEMGLEAVILTGHHGIHWTSARLGYSGDVYLHYGNSIMPRWATALSRALPVRHDMAIVDLSTKCDLPSVANELPGAGFLTAYTAGLARWLQHHPLGVPTSGMCCLESTMTITPPDGLFAGTDVKATMISNVHCSGMTNLGFAVSVYYDGHVGGTLGMALSYDELKVACPNQGCASCCRLLAALRAGGQLIERSAHQVWGTVLGVASRFDDDICRARLSWPLRDGSYCFPIGAAVSGEPYWLPPVVGWLGSLGASAVDEAERLLAGWSISRAPG